MTVVKRSQPRHRQTSKREGEKKPINTPTKPPRHSLWHTSSHTHYSPSLALPPRGLLDLQLAGRRADSGAAALRLPHDSYLDEAVPRLVSPDDSGSVKREAVESL